MDLNCSKRPFNFNYSTDVETKRLRKTSDEKNSVITRFEHLSNELLYEIFDYLDPYEIYEAFSKLNIRLHNLVIFSSLPLNINLSSKSISTLEHRCRHVIIPNKHRILSLHLNGYLIIRDFFTHCNIDASFNRLESVVLNGLSEYKVMMILFYLNALPRLFSLTIEMHDDSFFKDEESEISIPISINERFSTIEHLVINHDCNINELTSILSHTPHLRHLTCKNLTETEETIKTVVLLKLVDLKYVCFGQCNIEFDELEVFIKRICSQLPIWRLKTECKTAYLDGNRWKRLIRRHMPQLREFHFDHHVDNDDMDILPDRESIDQFTSKFWTEQQWFFEFKNEAAQYVYSIHPYRERWYDYCEHDRNDVYVNESMLQQRSTYLDIFRQQATTNACRSSISRSQFTIGFYPPDFWNLSFIDDMKFSFLEAQFNHLSIQCRETPVDLLIEIIHLLPQLKSLELSSLPLAHVSSLPAETTGMLLLVSITNEITRVKLNKMGEVEQIHLLMNLCPRMQYLEIECVTYVDLENLLGSILMNNSTCVPYLCCLSICTFDAHEKITQQLNAIIDFERLSDPERAFCDYTIQRTHSRIFLRWKL
ncbi:unnamed protein product [Rotaria magnacalcarata]|uniref:F-box domain-containing protein n=1 Tax=Rotaria magnacalcarata TaxID=392030 RepID=A0A816E5E2_9BILA|nr:unnamed protein product [Rotaria magnacalcarata]CAF1645443.1 unnamed protein product [Rotaria magnacalcarata]